MRVFLSYRRDDTGGRAGRLYDALIAEYGPRNVFQDVQTVTPGVDFTAQVGDAISSSDVALVVIGRDWLTSTSDDGRRRIDHPDDFVRREIAAALQTGMPVVPVLVDDAPLPSRGDLPDDIDGFVVRNAVSIRDASWHQDVRDLVDRLAGEARAVGAGGRGSRNRVIAGASAVAVIAAAALGWAIMRPGDDADSGETPPCAPAGDGWEELDVADGSSIDFADAALSAIITADRSWVFADGDHGKALVGFEVRNTTEPVEQSTDDEIYVGIGLVNGLFVDGLDQGDATCMSVRGDPQTAPGERVIATVGYDTDVDPRGAQLGLEVGNQMLVITDGA